MPVPSTIDDLSTTAGSNSPAGSETPTEGDNYIRTLSAFIALLRDKLDGTSDTGIVKNATFSGTMAGAASWSGLQTFAAGIAGVGTSKAVAKPATTSKISTTTLENDLHLVLALGVGVWSVRVWAPTWNSGVGTIGLKFGPTFSGTASTSAFGANGVLNGAEFHSSTMAVGDEASASIIGVASDVVPTDWVLMSGTITVTVAGNFGFAWAQNTSSLNATNIGIGAWMIATQVG